LTQILSGGIYKQKELDVMKSMVDLNLMYIFVHAAEKRSITKASESLELSKQTVSRKIIELESLLSVRLISRTTRSFSLTQPGEEYYKACAKIVADAQIANSSIKKVGLMEDQSIKISTPKYLGKQFAHNVLMEILKNSQYSNIELNVGGIDKDEDFDDYDIAITDLLPKTEYFVATPVGSIENILVASSDYNDRVIKRAFHGLCDDLTYIRIKNNDLFFVDNPFNISFRQILVDDIALAKDIALNGNGIACLPTIFCDKEIREGTLIVVPKSVRMQSIPLSICYARNNSSNRTVTRIVKVLMNLLQRLQKEQADEVTQILV
jgi:DNA-binding transcriptional LysR family regulator